MTTLLRQGLSIQFGLDYKDFVVVNKALLRPAEVDHLLGDSTKARIKLDWKPNVSFEELISMMVEADLERVKRQNDKEK